jgi:hypothetical protein
MAETPLHAAPLVSALHGALFTRRRQPRVQDRRAFGAEVRSSLGRIAPLRASRPCHCWSRTRRSRPAQRAPGSLEPSSPEYNHPCLQHRRLAQPCGTIPAQQSSRNMSSVSVSVKPVPRRFLRETEAVRGPKIVSLAGRGRGFRRPTSPTPDSGARRTAVCSSVLAPWRHLGAPPASGRCSPYADRHRGAPDGVDFIRRRSIAANRGSKLDGVAQLGWSALSGTALRVPSNNGGTPIQIPAST